jgi:hypothetical protein
MHVLSLENSANRASNMFPPYRSNDVEHPADPLMISAYVILAIVTVGAFGCLTYGMMFLWRRRKAQMAMEHIV